MEAFREVLEDCRLKDLGFEGDCFTWRNNQFTEEGFVRERLDRAVSNAEWRGMFLGARVVNGDSRHSDHRPVIIHTHSEADIPQRLSGRSFRFEAAWVEDERCKEIIKEAWNSNCRGVAGVKVADGLKAVAANLSNLSSNVLGELEKSMKKLKRELELCRRGDRSKANIEKEGVLRYRLEKVEDQIDTYWRQ